MRIEILVIVFLAAFGITFMNYKNKKESKEIKKKMYTRILETKKENF